MRRFGCMTNARRNGGRIAFSSPNALGGMLSSVPWQHYWAVSGGVSYASSKATGLTDLVGSDDVAQTDPTLQPGYATVSQKFVKFDPAVQAKDQRLEIADPGYDGSALTIAFIAKIVAVPVSGQADRQIMSQYLTTGNQRAWQMSFTNAAAFQFLVSSDGTGVVEIDTFGSITDGNIYYVLLTFDSGTVTAWVNGSSVTVTETGTSQTSIFDSTAKFAIGARDGTNLDTGDFEFADGGIKLGTLTAAERAAWFEYAGGVTW